MLSKELLNIPQKALSVPTVAELRLFAQQKGPGPQMANFTLDLASKGLRTSWNKAAAKLFASEFISRRTFACTDTKKIEAAFLVYLQALQTRYNKQSVTEGTDDAAKIQEGDNKHQKARYNRRTYVSNDKSHYCTFLKSGPEASSALQRFAKFC